MHVREIGLSCSMQSANMSLQLEVVGKTTRQFLLFACVMACNCQTCFLALGAFLCHSPLLQD